MSGNVQIYIEGQRAVIRQLSARGLPTTMQASILRKLISERNAAVAEARMRLYAVPRRHCAMKASASLPATRFCLI